MRHFFKTENMKRKCTENVVTSYNLLESTRQIADTNIIFTVAGICSTADFFAVRNKDTV